MFPGGGTATENDDCWALATAEVDVEDGLTPSGDRQKDESKTVIEEEMSPSIRQHSRNSSRVTTPSWFKSIF